MNQFHRNMLKLLDIPTNSRCNDANEPDLTDFKHYNISKHTDLL